MSDEFKDFLGTPTEIGSEIVYAATVGRSARLTLGTVTKIGKPKSPYSAYKVSITVQPRLDSWGKRYSTMSYNKEKMKYEVNRPAKPVVLHFTDRLMVLNDGS